MSYSRDPRSTLDSAFSFRGLCQPCVCVCVCFFFFCLKKKLFLRPRGISITRGTKLPNKRINYACTNALENQVQDFNLPIHDTVTSQSLPSS